MYAAFETPSLILTGEREDDDGGTEQSVAAMPDARCVRLPGVGHLASFYRSDIALGHALPFLRQHLAALRS